MTQPVPENQISPGGADRPHLGVTDPLSPDVAAPPAETARATARAARWAGHYLAALGQAVAYTAGLFGLGAFLADSPRAHHAALLTLTAVLAIT